MFGWKLVLSEINCLMMKYFYAVGVGRKPGIYNTCRSILKGKVVQLFSLPMIHRLKRSIYRVSVVKIILRRCCKPDQGLNATLHYSGHPDKGAECEQQVKSFSKAKFKKFSTMKEAEEFVKIYGKQGQEEVSTDINIQKISETSLNIVNEERKETKLQKRKREEKNDDINSSMPHMKIVKFEKLHEKGVYTDFTVDPDGYVQVYTDGACESNGQNNAKAGIGVWFGENHPLNVSRPVIGRPTNNTAEIQAVTVALTLCKLAGVSRVCINTDSQFLINSVVEWIPKWIKKEWKVANGNPVKNKKDFLDLLQAMKNIIVKWNHVRGHTGVEGNEHADRLAREGAARYTSPYER